MKYIKIVLMLIILKTSLNLQAGFNNLYNVNYPYTVGSGEIMFFKDMLYVVNTDEQYTISFMVLDSFGNYTISYMPIDTSKYVDNLGAGMFYYKGKILI